MAFSCPCGLRLARASGAALLLSRAGLLPAAAAPVTAPYTDTFQSTAVSSQPANFVTSANGAWAIQNSGGANFYQNTVAAGGGASYSVLQFSNLNATSAPSFTITTSFTLTGTVIDPNNRVGLAAFANNTVSTEYLADLTENGSARLIGVGGHTLTTTPAAVALGNLTLGSTYTETLTGSYANNGTLNLTFTVTGLFNNTQNTIILTGQDTAPLTGQYFGLRNNDAGSTALTANFQNFSVAVPEPSTVFAAVLLSGLAVIRARRLFTAHV